jgi:hypothetical protein
MSTPLTLALLFSKQDKVLTQSSLIKARRFAIERIQEDQHVSAFLAGQEIQGANLFIEVRMGISSESSR